MAAYPAASVLPIDGSSQRVPRDGREEDMLGDGAARVRKLHATKYDFNLTHKWMTPSQISTLESFITTNDLLDFTFVWPEDGVTYNVRFGKDAYRTQPVAGTTYRDAFVRLVGF